MQLDILEGLATEPGALVHCNPLRLNLAAGEIFHRNTGRIPDGLGQLKRTQAFRVQHHVDAEVEWVIDVRGIGKGLVVNAADNSLCPKNPGEGAGNEVDLILAGHGDEMITAIRDRALEGFSAASASRQDPDIILLVDQAGTFRVSFHNGHVVAGVTQDMAQMTTYFAGANNYHFHDAGGV
jgi:hypothetical protein